LRQQTTLEANRISEGLAARVETVDMAATMLAQDPSVYTNVQGDSKAALAALNSRAVAVRNRFDLDLIQIYNQQDEAHTNLLRSNLYRESSLIGYVQPGIPVVRVVDERVLLLSRVPTSGNEGTVIAGIDLEIELQRLVSTYRLSAYVNMSVEDISEDKHTGKSETLVTKTLASSGQPLDTTQVKGRNWYSQGLSLKLGGATVALTLLQDTSNIYHVTTTGIIVMIISTLLTTLQIGRQLLTYTLPYDTDVLNINIPADATPHTPWRLTQLSRRRYFTPLPPDRANGKGRPRYKVLKDFDAETDSDIWAVTVDRLISITPLSLDLTGRVDFNFMEACLRAKAETYEETATALPV